MRFPVFFFLAAFLLACCQTPAISQETPSQPTIYLNGEPVSWDFHILPFQDRGQTLGLLEAGHLTLLVEVQDEYRFTGEIKNDGRLYLEQDGKKILFGLNLHKTYKDEGPAVIDPFTGLDPADLSQVRGVRLDAVPSDEVLDLLDHLDAAQVFFTVTQEAGSDPVPAFPRLPLDTRFIHIRASSMGGLEDYGNFDALSSLVYLRTDTGWDHPLTTEAIVRNVNLKYLDQQMEEITNPAALGQLHHLEYLDLSWCWKMTETDFLSGMTGLRELEIEKSEVTDLSPLEDHRSITRVNAQGAPVDRLPRGPIPTLVYLNVVGTRLTDRQVARFVEDNPQCRVVHGWTSSLHKALQGVDRIRVRSGGTSYRDLSSEETLVEITEPAGIDDLIAHIDLQESQSGFHCACGGSPTFEFYRNGDLVVTLGFHHGQSMRWPDGVWPGDGMLIYESGEFLSEFLARKGAPEPLEERNAQKKRASAEERRIARYMEFLPAGVAVLLFEAEDEEGLINAFIVGEPDKGKRVALALKTLGCHLGSWNMSNMLDPVVIGLLKNEVPGPMSLNLGAPLDVEESEKTTAQDIVEAVSANLEDPDVVMGAARWYFGERNQEALSAAAQAELLPAMVEAGVTNPRLVNRRRTLKALEELGTAPAIVQLRRVLDGQFQVRQLEDWEKDEVGGLVQYESQDMEVAHACSDQAYAGLILARLADGESLEAMRVALEATQEPESRAVLEEALEILETEQ